jgi:hypothetical protein
MITAQGGIIGWVASLEAVLSGLSSPESAGPPEPVDEAWAKVPWIGKPDLPVPAVLPQPASSKALTEVTIDGAKPWPFTFPVGESAQIFERLNALGCNRGCRRRYGNAFYLKRSPGCGFERRVFCISFQEKSTPRLSIRNISLAFYPYQCNGEGNSSFFDQNYSVDAPVMIAAKTSGLVFSRGGEKNAPSMLRIPLRTNFVVSESLQS